jgi:hypothetical protein
MYNCVFVGAVVIFLLVLGRDGGNIVDVEERRRKRVNAYTFIRRFSKEM